MFKMYIKIYKLRTQAILEILHIDYIIDCLTLFQKLIQIKCSTT